MGAQRSFPEWHFIPLFSFYNPEMQTQVLLLHFFFLVLALGLDIDSFIKLIFFHFVFFFFHMLYIFLRSFVQDSLRLDSRSHHVNSKSCTKNLMRHTCLWRYLGFAWYTNVSEQRWRGRRVCLIKVHTAFWLAGVNNESQAGLLFSHFKCLALTKWGELKWMSTCICKCKVIVVLEHVNIKTEAP